MRALALVTAAAAFALPAAAQAKVVPAGKPLDWQACEGVPGWECATASVPKVYGGNAGKFNLAVTRWPAADQANKIGPLFVNYGGPGGGAVETTQNNEGLWAAFHEKFDIVAFDPRGTGLTSQAIDCQANQQTEGVYSQPFFEPGDDLAAYLQRIKGYFAKCTANNPGVLPYTSTANYARDMDALRRSFGAKKLNYFGFSYGTFIGQTYATLFPEHYRALVIDGVVDPDAYINHPMRHLRVQTAAFERALDRFMQACAARQDFCTFGGDDPLLAYDKLVEQANENPIPAGDNQPVTGDDINNVMITLLYSKFNWELGAEALNEAAEGDASFFAFLIDVLYEPDENGHYDPGNDRYLLLSAEQKYPNDLKTYVDACEESWQSFEHFWFNAGCVELYWRAIPVKAQGAFYGPFRVPESANTILAVGTRYDPATPYREAKAAVRQLGNARLLTMNGDGHTAYQNGSPCADAAIEAYVISLTLPAPGTQCDQEVDPFPAAQARAAKGHALAYQGRLMAPLR